LLNVIMLNAIMLNGVAPKVSPEYGLAAVAQLVEHSTHDPKFKGLNPGACTIKLFPAVIYEFS
jgi:hypothetical protein